uniref:Uncharacterized protein n=1 Tax=Rhizophora mucronata TaxID=61149 RepID=A0A2P2NER0_RHIMU
MPSTERSFLFIVSVIGYRFDMCFICVASRFDEF